MKKILIIDDEPLITKLVKYCLEMEKYSVFIENNGIDGLKRLRTEKFEVILLDIAMPGIHGLDILRIIRNDLELKDLKVIILSAFTNYKHEAYMLGCNDFVVKPFTASIILDAIEKLI